MRRLLHNTAVLYVSFHNTVKLSSSEKALAALRSQETKTRLAGRRADVANKVFKMIMPFFVCVYFHYTSVLFCSLLSGYTEQLTLTGNKDVFHGV